MAGLFNLITRLDWAVFHAVNSFAGRWGALDWPARLGSDDHILPVVMTLLVLALVLFARDHDSRERSFSCVICAVVAVAVSMLVLFAFNGAFFRPRPFTSHQVSLLFYHNTDSAFPSNAATLAFTLAWATLLFKRRMGALLLGLACLVGLSRVASGVHYPADVLGAAVLGLGCALLAKAAEPLYLPLARACNRMLYRLLCGWQPLPLPRGEGGGAR